MSAYSAMVNSWQMYLICGAIMLFLVVMCVVMLVKCYALAEKAGLSKPTLRRLLAASVSFSVLPAVSILIGMIALSGTLGVPMAWMRLSVIGALQYEIQVTDISLQAMGYNGMNDLAHISPADFGAIALVMAAGISGGLLCSIFFLNKYIDKLRKKPAPEETDAAEGGTDAPRVKKPSFTAHASICMFVGLCSAYFGAYIGGAVRNQSFRPLVITCISGACMLLFDALSKRKGMQWLEGFSLAASMLLGMTAAVLMNQWGVLA